MPSLIKTIIVQEKFMKFKKSIKSIIMKLLSPKKIFNNLDKSLILPNLN